MSIRRIDREHESDQTLPPSPRAMQSQNRGGRPIGPPSVSNLDVDEMLHLQREAGNASVLGLLTTVPVLQRAPAEGATVVEAPPSDSGALAKVKDVALSLAKDTAEGIAEDVVTSALPPTKVMKIAWDLGNAFGEGAYQGILKANKELAYDKDIATALADSSEGLTDKAVQAIQHVRHWQANAVSKLDDILKEGLRSMLMEVASEIGTSLLGKVINKGLEKLGGALSRLVRGNIAESRFVQAEAEAEVKGLAAEAREKIREAFADALAERIFDKAKEAVSTEAEGQQKMAEAGVPEGIAGPAVQKQAVAKMGLEDVINDVDQKVEAGVAEWPMIKDLVLDGHKPFKAASTELLDLHNKYQQMGTWTRMVSEREDAKKDRSQIYEQISVVVRKLDWLQTLFRNVWATEITDRYRGAHASMVSFDTDVDVLRKIQANFKD